MTKMSRPCLCDATPVFYYMCDDVAACTKGGFISVVDSAAFLLGRRRQGRHRGREVEGWPPPLPARPALLPVSLQRPCVVSVDGPSYRNLGPRLP